jgi:hypothetical protein
VEFIRVMHGTDSLQDIQAWFEQRPRHLGQRNEQRTGLFQRHSAFLSAVPRSEFVTRMIFLLTTAQLLLD